MLGISVTYMSLCSSGLLMAKYDPRLAKVTSKSLLARTRLEDIDQSFYSEIPM